MKLTLKKLIHTNRYYKLIQWHFKHSSPCRNSNHRFMFINSKYTSLFFKLHNFSNKYTNLHAILRNYDLLRQIHIICPLTNTFPLEEDCPIIITHKYIQPIGVALLESISKFKFNHTLYDLIHNSNHEFSAITEQVNIISALELLWPLLCAKKHNTPAF